MGKKFFFSFLNFGIQIRSFRKYSSLYNYYFDRFDWYPHLQAQGTPAENRPAIPIHYIFHFSPSSFVRVYFAFEAFRKYLYFEFHFFPHTPKRRVATNNQQQHYAEVEKISAFWQWGKNDGCNASSRENFV